MTESLLTARNHNDPTQNDTTVFTCHVCGETKVHVSKITTGYGIDADGHKVCFACCGKADAEMMRRDGRMTLYLTRIPGTFRFRVSNWPDSLSFPVSVAWGGKHNLGGRVTFVRFIGPDGAVWSGRQVGDNSQLCYCRRTKIDPARIDID